MLRNFIPRYFWVTWPALGIAAALFLFDMFSVVESRTAIIVLPKQATFVSAPANIERLLMTPTVQAQVKERWHTLNPHRSTSFSQAIASSVDRPIYTVTLEPTTSILTVKAAETDRLNSEQLMRVILTQIASTVTHYYNIETELDIRVIDGPYQRETMHEWPLYIGMSGALSFGITSLFFLLLMGLDSVFLKRMQGTMYRIPPETFKPSLEVPYWSQDYRDQTERVSHPSHEMQATEAFADGPGPETVQAIYQPETVSVESVFQETELPEAVAPFSDGQHAVPVPLATGPAPDNLPVLDELNPLERAEARLLKADIDATTQARAASAELNLETATPVGEPTQAEYKRRLNELLSGRL